MNRGSVGRRIGAICLGLVIAGGLTLVDASSSPRAIVISTVVLAPFVVSVLAGPSETALVGAVAIALTALSGLWHDNFGDGAYFLRLIVVAVGAGLSVFVARTRQGTLRDRERFELLAAVADVADGHLTLEQTAVELCELAVPGFADGCVIDVARDGGLRRLAARLAGPDARTLEARLRERPLPTGGEPGVGAAVSTGKSQLLSPITDEMLEAMAKDENDLGLLRTLQMKTAITVPLSSRGRPLGALTLFVTARSRRALSARDTRFVEVLAGRVALALDNAGLFTELQTMESQLTTALGNLAEAVTVQNAQGRLIYANQAAADVLGYSSPQELVATPAAGIVERFDSYREDGSPLDLADLPGRRVLAGENPGPLVVRIVDRRTGGQRWRQTKSSAVRDSSGHVKMIVNVIADITAAKRAELIQRLLAGAGEALSSSLDPRQTLQQVADLCVPDLADWCAVSLPDEQGALRAVAVAHDDPEKVALARRVGERYPAMLDEPRGAARVFRDQKAQVANDIPDELLVAAAKDPEHLDALRRLGMRAALIVPMVSGGRSIGVLSLVSAESARSFGAEDIELAVELARRAAIAVENARLYTERSNIARTLQMSLLPEAVPEIPGWQTATVYRPAGDENAVGGDFYEAVRLKDEWMLVVGDVTGRGAEAAALTGLMRHTLRTAATLTGSATQALEKLNRDLVARPQLSLCTAVCLVLREDAGTAWADIICAGHPQPVLVRDGTAEQIGDYGPVLGAYADESWTARPMRVLAGDIVILYSDGLVDAEGAQERFGAERLHAALQGASSAADAVARIQEALSRFEVGAQADDIAVLAIERVRVPAAAGNGGADQIAGRMPDPSSITI